MSKRQYGKNSYRGSRGGVSAGYRDAIDIEDAAHAINFINSRKRREARERKEAEHTKVSLAGGDVLAAWLRKDVS